MSEIEDLKRKRLQAKLASIDADLAEPWREAWRRAIEANVAEGSRTPFFEDLEMILMHLLVRSFFPVLAMRT